VAEFEFKLQQLSMGMTDGAIVQWYRQEGDRVAPGEPLVEIDTGKVNQDVESPETGTLARIVAQPDDVLDIGGLMCVIETDA
jgi:pyruvate dehydrogenase E2 component (dihydrolipoamide acetyltransferase)